VCYNSLPAPISESFESETFPPLGWSVGNPNAGSITWERTTLASKAGLPCARMYFFNYSTKGDVDYLYAPSIDVSDADSIFVSFERAYRVYDESLPDSLEILVSSDCGNTFKSVWQKGGNSLTTAPGAFTGDYIPDTSDWVKEKISLRPFV